MENEKELIVQPDLSKEIMLSRDPKVVLAEAKQAAQALMTVVAQKKNPVIFNKEQYLEFEDWQTTAKFYGLSVKVSNTTYVDFGGVHGYEAKAEVIRLSDGMVVSSADAMCLNDEDNWSTRTKYEWKNGERVKVGEVPVPLFQLRSMAQTRACAKALRNVLAWVVVLAGFKPTPAEEMVENESQKPVFKQTKPEVSMPQEKPIVPHPAETAPLPQTSQDHANPSNPISLPQSKRLYAIYKGNGWNDEDVKAFLTQNFGISSTKEIEREYYDDIVSHFSKPKPIDG